jgi:hypothetical protein
MSSAASPLGTESVRLNCSRSRKSSRAQPLDFVDKHQNCVAGRRRIPRYQLVAARGPSAATSPAVTGSLISRKEILDEPSHFPSIASRARRGRRPPLLAASAIAAGNSITLNLKGGYRNQERTACSERHHYTLYHRGGTVKMDGYVSPAPALPDGTWRVKIKIKQCKGGRFVTIWQRHARPSRPSPSCAGSRISAAHQERGTLPGNPLTRRRRHAAPNFDRRLQCTPS